MNEFSLIKEIKQSYYRQSALLKGVGDDGAVFRETQGDLVTAMDTFVENVHFSRETMSPEQIGYRVLAVNLSDLAAMGAKPMFYLVSVVIPSSWTKDIKCIFTGMNDLAIKHNMDLIGGDTVSGNSLTITITVIGKVQRNSAKYRSVAKPSDIVFVTGTLGDSRAGLHILQSNKNYKHNNYFIDRHRYPMPRIAFSQAINKMPRIALNDISDGLISEAAEIAIASNVSIVIDEQLIPVSNHFDQFSQSEQFEWKLFGGEDFELLGVTSNENWENIKKIGRKTNTKVTNVGYVQDNELADNKSNVYLKTAGKKSIVSRRGYTHLT